MFKFDVIESSDILCKGEIRNLIKKRESQFREKERLLGEGKNEIFIIAEGREGGAYGYALLLKKELKNIQEDVRELVIALPLLGYVWECAEVHLQCSDQYSKENDLELNYIFQSFYRGLYEELAVFGRLRDVDFLIMKLPSDVYTATKEFGLWPYVVELSPENSPDGFFHGILPLIGSQYNAYQQVWKV